MLDDLCENERLDEYSLHREISTTQTKEDEKDVQVIKKYIASKYKISNPGKLIHMITGVTLSDEEADNWLNCIERGQKHYLEHRESRIIDRSKSLFNAISLKHVLKKKEHQKRCRFEESLCRIYKNN